MIGLVYHDDYNKYDLGVNHPLIGDKPRKTMEFFKQMGLMKDVEVFIPDTASEKDLLRVHNPRYIERIRNLSRTGGLLSMDTPAPIDIYTIARLATGGTLLAGKKLFHEFEIMINPLAGFHHASRSYSSGFCFFNDVAVVIEYLRVEYNVTRFFIVDLDVHHANGTQEIYYNDPTVFNISFHQDGKTLYPGTGSLQQIGRNSGGGYTVNLPLPPGTGSREYKEAFESIIPILGKQFNPEVIIYQCGVDTHHSDLLANLNLTYQTYYYLGKNMKQLSANTCNKMLVLFGGGYNSTASVKSYYNIMCGLLNKTDYIKEDDITENRIEKVQMVISDLKKLLAPYWRL